MQYTTLALALTASTAYAQTDLSQVVSVLATALPSSLISEFETNSAAVASEISSEFAAGNTPSWFAALPTEVKSYLIPAVVEATSSANATGISSSVSGAPTVVGGSGNSTLATTGRTPSTTSGSSSQTTDSSGSDSDSSSATSSGGASLPTAVLGMGLAGAAGLVGLLAL